MKSKKNALETVFCGVPFPNPLILPSGIAQEIPKDHQKAIEGGAGGVTTKSLTVEPRFGNPMPRFIKAEHGFLNSIGLKGPGIAEGAPLIRDFVASSRVPVIVSIFAASVGDFQTLAEKIVATQPPIIELNLSCPNVKDDMGTPLGTGCASAEGTVRAVKKIVGKIPVVAKLSQNIPNIAEVAKACESAGADGITAINTIPGMAIDSMRRRPILGAKRGGLSGYPIKPAAVLAVYEIYEAVRIPIIGMGGVTTWQDVVEMMLAGATLVGVGSATYLHGMNVFRTIAEELVTYAQKAGIKNITDLIGLAHDKNI